MGTSARKQRYRINVNARDIKPVEGREEPTGCFTFFGTQGKSLTGYKEDILIRMSEGNLEDYVPHAVSIVVAKKYLVVARVTQDIYRQDNVLFHVSSIEAIDTTSPAPLAVASDDQRHVVQQNSAKDPAKDASTLSEGDSASVATPPRDVIEEFGSRAEEDTTSTSRKRKRKSRTVAPPGPKKQVNKNLYGM